MLLSLNYTDLMSKIDKQLLIYVTKRLENLNKIESVMLPIKLNFEILITNML